MCEYISDVCRKELKRGTKRPGVTMYVKYKFEICSSHALYITIYFMFIFIYLIFSLPADWVKEAGLTEPPTSALQGTPPNERRGLLIVKKAPENGKMEQIDLY